MASQPIPIPPSYSYAIDNQPTDPDMALALDKLLMYRKESCGKEEWRSKHVNCAVVLVFT